MGTLSISNLFTANIPFIGLTDALRTGMQMNLGQTVLLVSNKMSHELSFLFFI